MTKNIEQPMIQSPLEKLLADKEQIRHQCQQQEQRLNASVAYIQDHAGSLLLSGVSSLLFSGSSKTAKMPIAVPPSKGSQEKISLGLADYLSIGKTMIPLLWEIVQPLIITWGIRKAKTIISNAFPGKLTRKA